MTARPPAASIVNVFISAALVYDQRALLLSVSTDSAESTRGVCGHVECRHHNGRWFIN